MGLEYVADPEGGAVHFTVWDSGIGISREDQQNLFQPFTQLDAGLDREFSGTGLGLALVSRMTELHGGSVSVESPGVGEGTRFTATFPWEGCTAIPTDRRPTEGTGADEEPDEELEAAIEKLDPPLGGAAPLLLLAEDNEATIKTMSAYLKAKGYCPRTHFHSCHHRHSVGHGRRSGAMSGHRCQRVSEQAGEPQKPYSNNPAERRLFGGAEDLELEGQDLWKLIAPHALDSCRSSLGEILNGSKDRVLFEVDCVTQAGEGFSAELSAGPFPSEEGVGVEIVIRDVSERKRMEEEVQQSQRLDAIGRVSAGIAHDFNNVLQAIMTPAQLALEDAPKEGTLRDDLAGIVQATREGRVLAKQLLTFARHESVARRVVDLNGVLTEIEPIARILGGKGLQFNFDLSEEVLPVQADSGQLKQIITNLVVNARDALPDGGFLTVSNVSTDTEAELSVADNGHGMDEEIMDRIFEPFFSTKDSDEGTGLGLSVVRGIVEGHQGTISVESVVGEGTIFRIRLPLASPAPES